MTAPVATVMLFATAAVGGAPPQNQPLSLTQPVLADQVGRTILRYANAQTFAVVATLALGYLVYYRWRAKKPMTRAFAFKLVAAMLEIYLAITIWAVFTLTSPPAVELLHAELLPYVGLLTLIVMFGSVFPMLFAAFKDGKPENGAKPPGAGPPA